MTLHFTDTQVNIEKVDIHQSQIELVPLSESEIYSECILNDPIIAF